MLGVFPTAQTPVLGWEGSLPHQRQEESSFSLANSMQESVTFRDIFFISSVFILGEVDGLKDLLISGQVAATAFKEFPNVPQQLK